MSDSIKAVFLSYASQDAEAARRICEALRTAGVEVWFDQSELVGGDAWDQKIRKQIKDCALLIPIISTATQTRTEGYFRLEWRLADQRTHLMAKGRPFLLPVVIDTTHDADAQVPDSFIEVQWTRLPGGETPPKFAERVKKLLSGGEPGGGTLRSDSSEPSGRKAPSTTEPGSAASAAARLPRWLRPVLASAAIVIAVLAVTLITRRDHEPAAPSAGGSSPAVEIARVRANLRPDEWTRADFDAFTPVADRLIQANPENGEAWALRGIAYSLLVVRNLDTGTQPLQVGKDAADRALRLAPGSPLAELSLGLHLIAMISRGGDPLACRAPMDRAVAGLPNNENLTRYAELCSYWLGYQFEGTDKSARAWLTAAPGASFPAWILAQSALVRRHPDEAVKWAAQASVDPEITGVRSFVTTFEAQYYLLADLEGARAALDHVPTGQRSVHRVLASRWLVAMAEKHFDQALQELSRSPDAMLRDRLYHGPKALLAGLAHEAAGRRDVARVQFGDAERILRTELTADPDNQELRAVLALSLACLGHAEEARRELAAVEPLLTGQDPTVYTGHLIALIAQVHGVLGEIDRMIPWLRILFTKPSQLPFTPASLRLDPRFGRYAAEPPVQALLGEFSHLDQTTTALAVEGKSVAVLAFANLSDDKGNEYFSDGISEELLNVLAKVPGLTVRGRSSGFYFKGKQVKSAEIGSQLNVAYLVQGSVRRSGDRVRISAQLIRAATDEVVWSSGSLDRDLKDIFAVQDEIAGLIAKNLSLKMGVAARAPHEVNPEALTALLEGRHFWVLRTMEGFARAGELFNRAVALDPDWAPAHAALASLLAIEASYLKGGGESVIERFARAAREAKRAIELDPTLGEPHAALGKIAMEDRRFAEAEEEFRRALLLEPNNALVLDWHGDLMVTQGRLDAAIAGYRRAAELEPLSPYILWDLAWELMHVRRYGEALALVERAAALTPTGAARLSLRRARLLLELGRKTEAEVALRAYLESPRTGSDPQIANEAVWCLQELGSPAERERWTAELLRQYPDSFASGVILLILGREAEAYPLLERFPPIFWQQLYWEPFFDSVRDTPRFQQLLEKLGCAAEYKVARETHARLLKEQGK